MLNCLRKCIDMLMLLMLIIIAISVTVWHPGESIFLQGTYNYLIAKTILWPEIQEHSDMNTKRGNANKS